ncbi:MAG: DNA repair helicase [Ignavibacteria bacterium]
MIELSSDDRSSPVLTFQDGSLVLAGAGQSPCPFFRLHGGILHALPIDYVEVLTWFASKKFPLDNRGSHACTIDVREQTRYEDRDYQQQAVEAWKQSWCRGCVVLPTGAGKTVVALKAIAAIGRSTLIILPTLDLMNQWYGILSNTFPESVGILGGGYHEVKALTVTTYDSAFRYIDLYGNRFNLLIFDEVHHLPSETYSQIAELSLAPYRLGLTATFRGPDGKQAALTRLVGPLVFERTIDDLKGSVLADFEIQRIWVELTEEEKNLYETKYDEYVRFVRERNISLYGKGWDRFIKMTASDSSARSALLAKNEAARIAAHASAKFDVLELLLKLHVQDRVLIFTKSVPLTYDIAGRYLIPPITHYTDTKERKEILEKFRSGKYWVIVSSEVLNEGVDVPAANVAIILSGTASPLRHLQRLGRILRKKDENRALLYEVISRGTNEREVSRRRRTQHTDASTHTIVRQ